MKIALAVFVFSFVKLNFSGNITKAGLYFYLSAGMISSIVKAKRIVRKSGTAGGNERDYD
jgi:hypothetical protein